MKKEFTFKTYFLYVLRYWLLTAIIAVAGMAGGILYGILGHDANQMRFTGNITISGFSSLVEDLQIGDSTDPVTAYNLIKKNAFAAMTSTDIKTALYKSVKNEWCAMSSNKKLSEIDAREKFFRAISIREEDLTLYVSFTQKAGADKAFSYKVVEKYLALAKERAVAQEMILQKPTVVGEEHYDKLTVSEAEEEQMHEVTGVGVFKGAAVGVVAGVVLALLTVLVMYLADKKINTYGDIAAFTGHNLLGVSTGAVTNKVCPRIDCEMQNDKALMICGHEDMCYRLAEVYGEYAFATERKTLRIDFSHKADADTFGDYMRGKPLDECVRDENGVSVLSGVQSWALVLTYPDKTEALRERFDRIVIAAPYHGDGSLGVLAYMSDKIVYAVNQSEMKAADVLYAAQEVQCDQKAAGAAIEKTGKSYVGGQVYFAPETDEE
ncbi:MAG: hypothetical protein HFE46_03635 [Clostridia bacterium]|nr:hypothetical protein [Clostridia bacterium]